MTPPGETFCWASINSVVATSARVSASLTSLVDRGPGSCRNRSSAPLDHLPTDNLAVWQTRAEETTENVDQFVPALLPGPF